MTDTVDKVDVLVAGGGYVGLSAALAIAASVPGARVALVDPRPWRDASGDLRAFAVAAAGRRMLMALGIWDKLVEEAEPVREMIVTDSGLDDLIRPVFLTFDRQEDGDPLAHMLPNGPLVTALGAAAEAAGVRFLTPDSVLATEPVPGGRRVTLTSGKTFLASLVVAADGAHSRLRAEAGIGTNSWSYGQSGIVATIEHDRPHEGRAEEHFLPAGPFAILPLKGGHRSSLVWSERTDIAERLVSGAPFLFDAELIRRIGHRLGELRVIGRRQAFPLGLTLARRFTADRLALIGDAAHAIHPIAGQGLNLGFKDAAALAEVVALALRAGRDPGTTDVLDEYQRWRGFDTLRMAAMTDGLNRLFSNDLMPLRLVRDFGLGLVDRMPPVKRLFANAAAGAPGPSPRLVAGEPI
ncbi:FAD-dependent monooxygenase [Pleomorphomonas sp. PLEO]|uniref:FAD-dependent monooxygenase n=1 Tax=Pleomorphomonas sp. PLEO TaxID=3239306 RepID=UPI00351ECEE6